MVRMTAHVESITYKVERWFETVVFGEPSTLLSIVYRTQKNTCTAVGANSCGKLPFSCSRCMG
jgi:hypothetical protein